MTTVKKKRKKKSDVEAPLINPAAAMEVIPLTPEEDAALNGPVTYPPLEQGTPAEFPENYGRSVIVSRSDILDGSPLEEAARFASEMLAKSKLRTAESASGVIPAACVASEPVGTSEPAATPESVGTPGLMAAVEAVAEPVHAEPMATDAVATASPPTAEYQAFLQSKLLTARVVGFSVDQVHPMLYSFQGDIVRWACRLGCAAIFAGCGLGKTLMQLDWCRLVLANVEGAKRVIIVAPLAVAHQTIAIGQVMGIPVTYARTAMECQDGINITNYERIIDWSDEDFVRLAADAVCLDESSILKSFMGKTKRRLQEVFKNTPYKLCCTATPSPNDHLELGNHAEFLNIMTQKEMVARWFVADTAASGNTRLKGHAEESFWAWVATWAVNVTKPSDLGYPDEGFALPPLNKHFHVVSTEGLNLAGESLIPMEDLSATNLHRVMRATCQRRVDRTAELVKATGGTWLIWCNTNYEADAIRKAIPDAVDLRGSETIAIKESKLNRFVDGQIPILSTKPSIAGFGMNIQICHQMAFVGLSYSFEDLYQAIRRCWRFGQKFPVECHIITSDAEGSVAHAIARKEKEFDKMQESMIAQVRDAQLESIHGKKALKESVPPTVKSEISEMLAEGKPVLDPKKHDRWKLYLGDCCDATKLIPDNSQAISVFSPPFSNLYVYSDAIADMGNSVGDDEFFKHFSYLVPELYRVTMSGRLCVVHCKDLSRFKGQDGVAGLKDFPGKIIHLFEQHNWVFHSRVTIWKDPVTEMQRTKSQGLLYKQVCKDSCFSRQAGADYLIIFRKCDFTDKPPCPVVADGERFKYYVGEDPPDPTQIADNNNLRHPMWNEETRSWPHNNPFPDGSAAFRAWSIACWQKYASPVWMDISQSNTLNRTKASAEADEKHICPLQLDLIERCVHLWTNHDEMVFSPFAGIGSEGVGAIRAGRKFTGIELKPEYHAQAIKNLRAACVKVDMDAGGLFA